MPEGFRIEQHLGEALHKTLLRLRRQRGITLIGLTKRSGLSARYISYLEQDANRNPSLEVLDRLAKGLGISLSGFVREIDRERNRRERVELTGEL